jgi:PTS system nitrogen regulatory IIA component
MSQTTLGSLLGASRVQCGASTTSKKKSIQLVAELIEDSLDLHDEDDDDDVDMDVFDALTARERLGCTGMGHGIAIPHGRGDFGSEPVAALVTLADPVDFDSPDNEPVDVVFGLLIPEEKTEAHLHILASVARFFNEPENRSKVRQAKTAEEILSMLNDCEISQSSDDAQPEKKLSSGSR